jgi:hypothetical protein
MGTRYNQNVIESVDFSPGDVNAPAVNTAAVVAYAAPNPVDGSAHVINGIAWSYSAAPTGGNLKVEDGSGNVVFTMDITAAGPGVIDFPLPKAGSPNATLTITLAAGGSGVTGKVSVLGHWQRSQ